VWAGAFICLILYSVFVILKSILLELLAVEGIDLLLIDQKLSIFLSKMKK